MSALALFMREARLAWAGGGGPAGPAAFNLAALVLAPLAIGPSGETLALAGPGVIAFAMLLSTLQSAEKLFGEDAADGTLELYALSGPGLTVAALVKSLAHMTVTLWPAPPLAFIAALAYGLEADAAFALSAGLLIAAPGLVFIAGIAGALAAGLKRAGLLIALIAAPLQVPLLIFASGAGRAAAEDTGLAGANLMMAGAASLAALALGPIGIAAALRARLE